MPVPKVDKIRFYSKVNKRGSYPHKKACKVHPEIKDTRCWEWTGLVTQYGYGNCLVMIKNKREQLAHRIAFILSFNYIPKEGVRHKCDNRLCVRSLHLFEGTPADDSKDKCAKGRQSRGQKHSLATSANRSKGLKHSLATRKKISLDDALAIRKKYATGKFYQRELGEEYGISQVAVGCIIRNVHLGAL